MLTGFSDSSSFQKAKGFSDSYDPYRAAYDSMPSHAAANPAIQQMYINGRFCYAFKFGIVTNGLGIVRHISFYNKDFLESHPEIIVEKKSASPDVGQVPHRLQSTGSDAEGFLSEASPYQSHDLSGRCRFRFHQDL